MGIAERPEAARRSWSIRVQLHHDRLLLTCEHCGPLPRAEDVPLIRSAVLTHLAGHARGEALAVHLRICRCGAAGCRWHGRHRGCAGPVGLTLARAAGGRVWRLADTCLACAAATDHAAVVPEPSGGLRAPGAGADGASPAGGVSADGNDGFEPIAGQGYLWWDSDAEATGWR